MYLLNGAFRTALPGRGLFGLDYSQGFTLGYFPSLPPGGARSAQGRFRHTRELCEAAMNCYFGQAEEALVTSEARER
jgi:hypothetical protein